MDRKRREYQREYRKRNPLKYAYLTLKHNAKRRGHAFELTFEDFKAFCYVTDYIGKKGITKTSYSIDRIDNTKGYILSNIRVVTVSDNSKKGTKVLHYDWQHKVATVIKEEPIFTEEDEDLPF